MLAERGIEHALLNAKQDQFEAEVIARAGAIGPGNVRRTLGPGEYAFDQDTSSPWQKSIRCTLRSTFP